MTIRVCLVTHRFGGHNGVAREAEKWRCAAGALGWHVTRAGGLFTDHAPGDVVVRGMWADRPGAEPPPVDHPTIRRLCAEHDLVVLDNAGTLFSAPLAARAWEEHALAVGVPVVLRHHDPPWQGAPLRPVTGDAVPLHDRRHLHVLINERTRRDFARRWPELVAAGGLRVVHNRVDTDPPRRLRGAAARLPVGGQSPPDPGHQLVGSATVLVRVDRRRDRQLVGAGAVHHVLQQPDERVRGADQHPARRPLDGGPVVGRPEMRRCLLRAREQDPAAAVAAEHLEPRGTGQPLDVIQPFEEAVADPKVRLAAVANDEGNFGDVFDDVRGREWTKLPSPPRQLLV